MTVTKEYRMEYGQHKLSESEVTVLRAVEDVVRRAVEQDPDGNSLAVPLHKVMLWFMSDTPSSPKPDFDSWTHQEILTWADNIYTWNQQTTVPKPDEENTWVPKSGIDVGIWTVVWGALDINQGITEHTDFQGLLIAEYTIAQVMARTGTDRNDAIELNQTASNEIALRLASEILASGGQVPLLFPFGIVDASAAASKAFGGDYAGWAGIQFFPLLGPTGRNYIDDWILQHEMVEGTIADRPGGTITF